MCSSDPQRASIDTDTRDAQHLTHCQITNPKNWRHSQIWFLSTGLDSPRIKQRHIRIRIERGGCIVDVKAPREEASLTGQAPSAGSREHTPHPAPGHWTSRHALSTIFGLSFPGHHVQPIVDKILPPASSSPCRPRIPDNRDSGATVGFIIISSTGS